jgi:hypothetical protein
VLTFFDFDRALLYLLKLQKGHRMQRVSVKGYSDQAAQKQRSPHRDQTTREHHWPIQQKKPEDRGIMQGSIDKKEPSGRSPDGSFPQLPARGRFHR